MDTYTVVVKVIRYDYKIVTVVAKNESKACEEAESILKQDGDIIVDSIAKIKGA